MGQLFVDRVEKSLRARPASEKDFYRGLFKIKSNVQNKRSYKKINLMVKINYKRLCAPFSSWIIWGNLERSAPVFSAGKKHRSQGKAVFIRYDGLSSGGAGGFFWLSANGGSGFNLKEWLEEPQGSLLPQGSVSPLGGENS